MGKAKLAELRHDLPSALAAVTELTVKFTWFVPALVEKARLLLAANDWDQAMEHVARVLQADAGNVMALAWTALFQVGGGLQVGGRAPGGVAASCTPHLFRKPFAAPHPCPPCAAPCIPP